MRICLGIVLFCLSLQWAGAETKKNKASPALTPDPMGLVATLPSVYPKHWLMVTDAAFFHMLSGKIIVIDADAETVGTQVKGMVNASFIAIMSQATTKPEIYVAESFYSRGVRGERTDVVTIYDKSTLDVIGEVVLPTGKRASSMPQRYGMTLIDNDRLLLIYNFTPAQSVTVVDTEARRVVAEIPIPGCVLVYPTGNRGFSSLCSNGGFLSTQLDSDGGMASQQRLDPFFDTDKTPIFERPGIINGVAYFPTFDGRVQPINLNGDVAEILTPWSLVSEDEKAANWRPGGIAFTAKDEQGHFYVIMHPDGKDGTQNSGGTEVWAFDVATKTRTQKITLQNWAVSIEVTGGEDPLLVVTNGDFALDIYQAHNGEFVRTITNFGQQTPFVVHGAR